MDLWLPTTAKPAFRCMVPKKDGTCGAEFHREERFAYEQHVSKCATANEDVIQAKRPSIAEPVYGGAAWDQELEDFVQRTGRI